MESQAESSKLSPISLFSCKSVIQLSSGSPLTRATLIKSLIIALLLTTSLVEPTSNINSIWLPRDDSVERPQFSSRDDVVVAGNGGKQLVERAGDWPPATRGSPGGGQVTLQAASSSLQPAIVSGDEQQLKVLSGSRKRILVDSIPAPISSDQRNRQHANFSNEASSLSHQWSANQTNAEVQFDEEQNQNQTSAEGYASEDKFAASRRRNETTSPRQSVQASSNVDDDDGDDGRQSLGGANSSQPLEVPSAIDEYSANEASGSNNSRNSAGSTYRPLAIGNRRNNIYHLTSDDKGTTSEQVTWNSQAPQNGQHIEPLIIEAPRRVSSDNYNDLKLHSNPHSFTPSYMMSPRSTLAHGNTALNLDLQSNVDASGWPIRINQASGGNNKWAASQSTLSYGFVPHTATVEDEQQQQQHQANAFQQTTPMPSLYAAKSHPNPTRSPSLQPLAYYAPAVRYLHQPMPLVAPQMVQHPPRLTAQSLGLRKLSQQQRQVRREVEYSTGPQIIRSRYTPDSGGSRSQSSFLRNFPPILNYIRPTTAATTTTTTTARPRKSLLSSLGGRFNGWTSDSGRNMESLFYEGLSSGPTGKSQRVQPMLVDQQQALASLLTGSLQQVAPQASDYLYLAPPAGLQGYTRPVRSQGGHLLRPPQVITYPFQGTGYSAGGSIHQPTVAPAPSSLTNFYGTQHAPVYSSPARIRDRTKGPQVQQQQQNFIPVVAVEVTKTSPAPKPMGQDQEHLFNNNIDSDPGSQIEEYLESKTQGKPRLSTRSNSRTNNRQNNQDDYGNLAAGSIIRDSPQRHSPIAGLMQTDPSSLADSADTNPNHVTTSVKSAVFGYLPHQAEAPLVQAMSLLPHLTPTKSASALGYPSQLVNHLPSASDVYVNHNHLEQPPGQGHNFADALAHQHMNSLNFASDPMIGGVEEPPSLALQLQANSIVQNDIAHPFNQMDASSGPAKTGNSYVTGQQYAASPSSLHVDHVKPIDVFPVNQASGHYPEFQLFSSDSANGQPMSYLNPLLAGDNRNPNQVYAAASELNPFLPPVLLANPNNPFAKQPVDSSHGNELAEEDENRPMKAASSLNNKGNKKRSSEFFANAGQLLLSALPLLLAPTLGLMFASSPNPVARYHAPGALNSGSVHTSIPGTYINSLASGMVSNASPAPHMFTPTPPGYNSSVTAAPMLRPQRSSGNSSISSGQRQATTAATFSGTSTTTSAPLRNLFYANQSLDKPTSTTRKPVAIILTTLSPPPFGNTASELIVSDFVAPNSSASDSRQTFLLLSQDDEGGGLSSQVRGNGSANANHHYEVGHEGVDFDTQYASLKRPGLALHEQVATTRQPLIFSAEPTTQSPARNRNVYHYSEVLADGESSINLSRTTPAGNKSLGLAAADLSTRLYPMSTWPPLRRRTVSLVTSNGNRTLIDSSEKYLSQLTPIRRQQANMTTSFRNANRRESNFGDVNQSLANSTKRTPVPEEGVLLTLSHRLDSANKTSGNQARHKRSAGQVSNSVTEQPEFATSSEQPTRKVKIVKRVKRRKSKPRKQEGRNSTLDELSTSGSASHLEQLRQDSSKNKPAHVIAALVAHAEDQSDLADDLDGRNRTDELSPDYNLSREPEANSTIEAEIRDQQMRRKMLLEGAAMNGGEYEAPDEGGNVMDLPQRRPDHRRNESVASNEDERASEDFSSGGRGRFPQAPAPPPIEVTSTRIKVYTNETERAREKQLPSRTEILANGERLLVLNEDTRKALANFGSLLLKDTLQIPKSSLESEARQRRSRKETRNSPPRYYQNSDPNLRNHRIHQDYMEGAGYSSEPAPHRESEFARRNPHPRAAQYGQQANRSANEYHNRNEHHLEAPGSRYRLQGNESSPSYLNESMERATSDNFARPIRDRVNLIETSNSHHYSSESSESMYQPPPLGEHEDRYNKSPEGSPISRYNSFLASKGFNATLIGANSTGNYSLDSPDSHYPGGPSNYSSRRVEPLASAPSGYGDHYGTGLYNTYYTGPNRYNREKADRPPYHQHPDDYRNYSAPVGHGGYYGAREQPPPPPPPPPQSPPPPPPHHNYPPGYGQYEPYAYHNQQQPSPAYGQQRDSYNYGPTGYSRPDRAPTQARNVHSASHSMGHSHSSGAYFPQQSQQKYSYPAPESRFSPVPGEPPMHEAYPPNGRPGAGHGQHYGTGGHSSGNYGLRNHVSHQYDSHLYSPSASSESGSSHSALPFASAADRSEAKTVNEYLKRVHFSDSDRDKLMASYLTCDGLLNDNDHCLERLSCEFSDPLNIEKANKLDRAVSSILLGHILINTYIPNQFKLRLKSASLFGYTQSGKCSRYVCNKLVKSTTGSEP